MSDFSDKYLDCYSGFGANFGLALALLAALQTATGRSGWDYGA